MLRTRTTIKKFIKAKSAEELEKVMLINNQTLGASFDYDNIQYANGNWYAWFYADVGVIRASDMLEKPLTKQIKKNTIKKVGIDAIIK